MKYFAVTWYFISYLSALQVNYDDFIPMFEAQYPAYKWTEVEVSIYFSCSLCMVSHWWHICYSAHLSVYKIITFSFSSPEPLGHFQLNSLGYDKFVQLRASPFLRGDNGKITIIHSPHLLKIFFRTTWPIIGTTKLSTKNPLV